MGLNEKNSAIWDCVCDCGNHKCCTGVNLRRNHVTSCGCNKSMCEQRISDWLDKNGYKFTTQKSFPDCLSNRNHRLYFDFEIIIG